MLKKSLLIATGLLACTLMASQAQAVVQTIQWNFNTTFGPAPNHTYNGSPLLPGMTAAQDDIDVSGGTTTDSTFISLISPTAIQGNSSGVGVASILPVTTIDSLSGTSEFIKIIVSTPLSFISANSLIGVWSISFTGIGAAESASVFTSSSPSTALSLPLLTAGGIPDGVFLSLPGTVLPYLYIRQTGGIDSSFQVAGLRFRYDDGCLVGGCVTPEPGMLGLLGFSLFGLAFLRKRK